jgi:glycosyltransferase involved in cell wall biosynthesis
MRALHITFRYGKDIYGGAELYFRHISEELVKFGVSVDVCTTKTITLHPLFHSSVLFDNELSNEDINGVSVFRFATKNPNRLLAYFFERLYHWQLNREEDFKKTWIQNIALNNISNNSGILLTGWNNIERHNGKVARWTKKETAVIIYDNLVNKISCLINNPAGLTVTVECITENSTSYKKSETFFGYKEISLDFPPVTGKIIVNIICNHTMRFIRDHRALGVWIYDFTYYTKNDCIKISMETDYHDLLIQTGDYLQYLVENAQSRPKIFSKFFDYMRGPNSGSMERWLKQNISSYDIVLVQMFPFNTIKYAMEAKKQNIPLVLLPLMHIDDEFYHWSHYYSYLKEADKVLALSKDSKSRFYDALVNKCDNVGAGIDRDLFLGPKVSGQYFRERFNLEDKCIILTVSRKNPGKKYDVIIRAMKEVTSQVPNAILVMIGPDDDNIPITEDYVHYLGKVDDPTLADAYDACSVFAMMSESESFGMVFCEAWSRKKPVIGNKGCGAVTSLIDDGVDGILCANDVDVAAAVIRLLSDYNLSSNMGVRGYQKVVNSYTWDKVTEKIYSIYTELL